MFLPPVLVVPVLITPLLLFRFFFASFAFFASRAVFLSSFAILLIFLTQYYNRKGKKDLHFRYTKHITRTSRVWQSTRGADLFSTSYSQRMASGSLFFTKSASLPIFDPILQQEGKKRYTLPLYQTHHKKLSSVASYLGCRYF